MPTTLKTDTFLANTNKQKLAFHSFAVGTLASEILKSYATSPSVKNLQQVAFIVGCLHDAGKIDPPFQTWLNKQLKKTLEIEDGFHIATGKFSFEKHALHNEISALIFKLLFDNTGAKMGINRLNTKRAEELIFWHHAKRNRKSPIKDFGEIMTRLKASLSNEKVSLDEFTKQVQNLIDDIKCIAVGYGSDMSTVLVYNDAISSDDIDVLYSSPTPSYRSYPASPTDLSEATTAVDRNAKTALVRCAIIEADRAISQLSADDLENHIKNKTLHTLVAKPLEKSNLPEAIKNCLQWYEDCFPNSPRNKMQSECAAELHSYKEYGSVALKGAAGCGKTKIAVEWAQLTDAKQIIIVAPRTQVCQSLNEEFCEILPDANIELLTSDFKCMNSYDNVLTEEQAFSGDVVITTLDQLIKIITTHKSADKISKFMNAHLIIDEYHEFANVDGLNLLLAEIMYMRSWCESNSNTLLVSATPNYAFTKNFLKVTNFATAESPNDKPYMIVDEPIIDDLYFSNQNPIFNSHAELEEKVTFVISNIATYAQVSFLANKEEENAVLFHSKFKKKDKAELFEKVFSAFKKNGTRTFDVLKSGSIVQASLNITCDLMYSEATTPENELQRMGRLDRFAESTELNVMKVVMPVSFTEGKKNSSMARFLTRINNCSSALAWHTYLTVNKIYRTETTIAELYKHYDKFYKSDIGTMAATTDLLKSIRSGCKILSSDKLDPIAVTAKKQKEMSKVPKFTVRGSSRFTKLAVCDMTDPLSPIFLDEYTSGDNEPAEMTDDLMQMIQKDQVSTMARVDARISENSVIKGIPATKANIRNSVLLNAATQSDKPIYLSYTPSDLGIIGLSKPEKTSEYYVVCDKQPVGKLSLDKIYELSDQ